MTLEQFIARNNLEIRITYDEESHWTEKRGVVVDREYHITIQNKDRQMMHVRPKSVQKDASPRYSKNRIGVSIEVKDRDADVWKELHIKLIERINKAVPFVASFATRRQDTPIEISLNKPLEISFPEKPESFKL